MPATRETCRLVSYGGSPAPGEPPRKRWHCATNDAQAAIQATGYFNAFIAEMNKGDIIDVSADLDGTPELLTYMVTSTTTNVVIGLQSVT